MITLDVCLHHFRSDAELEKNSKAHQIEPLWTELYIQFPPLSYTGKSLEQNWRAVLWLNIKECLWFKKTTSNTRAEQCCTTLPLFSDFSAPQVEHFFPSFTTFIDGTVGLTSTMHSGSSLAKNRVKRQSNRFFQPSLSMLPWWWARENTVCTLIFTLGFPPRRKYSELVLCEVHSYMYTNHRNVKINLCTHCPELQAFCIRTLYTV